MPEVLASGFMVGLIEWACIQAVNPHLNWPQEQTVGIDFQLNHSAATPPGLTVTVKGRLENVEGRKLTFYILAEDDFDQISEAFHHRFVIDAAQFNARQAAFTLASSAGSTGVGEWRDPYELLDQAWLDYDQAVRGLLVYEAGGMQRLATLHWVAVQVESLSSVLGKERDEARWQAAKLCADLYCDHQKAEERAWAHASLAELCLVRLADRELDDVQKKAWSTRALEHTRQLARLYPGSDEFPVRSTASNSSAMSTGGAPSRSRSRWPAVRSAAARSGTASSA